MVAFDVRLPGLELTVISISVVLSVTSIVTSYYLMLDPVCTNARCLSSYLSWVKVGDFFNE